MGYYIDAGKITIDEYRTKPEPAYLPPGRLMLKEKPDERFGFFKSTGIATVKELIQLLRKKDKFGELAKLDCFSDEYLTVLLRELNSIFPEPNKIADFAGISKSTIDKLEDLGIKNTEIFYDKVITKSDRHKLAATTGIDYPDIPELTKLTDLSGIKWVGVTFARMLYHLGVDTVEKASKSDPVDLHEKINLLNQEKSFYKGHIGLNDIKIFVNAAKDIPSEIEY